MKTDELIEQIEKIDEIARKHSRNEADIRDGLGLRAMWQIALQLSRIADVLEEVQDDNAIRTVTRRITPFSS